MASMGPNQLYDFDARMASKLFVMDEVMNPILEKDPFLELALRDMAHPTLSDTISTLSEPSEFPLLLPFTVTNGKQIPEDTNKPSFPELLPSPTGFSFGVYEPMNQNLGGRVLPQAVGENLMRHNLTATNPLSGDYTTNSFSLMSNPEHDLYGFLSQAVPLTQMASAATEGSAQGQLQTLSNMPCILPMNTTVIPHTPPPAPNLQSSYFPETYRQIYSASGVGTNVDPMVSVVKPVISKDAVAQTSLTSVSLAVSRGSPTATSTSPASKRSAATVAEIGLVGNKRTASRLYECPICHKMFERAYNRKMHITTHEAIENRLKPFVCPLESCGKRFARKHDKNRHYLGVHLRARKSGAPTDSAEPVPPNVPAATNISFAEAQTPWGVNSPLQETQATAWPV